MIQKTHFQGSLKGFANFSYDKLYFKKKLYT